MTDLPLAIVLACLIVSPLYVAAAVVEGLIRAMRESA